MGLAVKNIAERLLDLTALTTSDTLPTGLARAIEDAIKGSIGEMRQANPGYFQSRKGGVLQPPTTTTAAMTTSARTTATLGVAPQNILCTARIAEMDCDVTITAINNLTATISPGWSGAANATVTATLWHDAFLVSDGSDNANVGVVCTTTGRDLERVSSRAQAQARMALDMNGRRRECAPGDTPRFFWIERSNATLYACVYPMPTARTPIEVMVEAGIAAEYEDAADVFTDDDTYHLSDAIAREILLPLAKLRFSASPFFRCAEAMDEIKRQGSLALDNMAKQKPKQRRLPDWLEGQMPRRPWNGSPTVW